MTSQTTWQLQRPRLIEAMKLACAWLQDRSQLREEPAQSPDTIYHHPQLRWAGCFREYEPATCQWKYYAPCWHTGQAIKALVMAHRLFPDEGYLDSARLGAEFLRDNCVTDGEDRGLLLMYESRPADLVGVPGITESLLGLICFAQETGEASWWDVVTGALDWELRRAYLPGLGRSRVFYHPIQKEFVDKLYATPCPHGGRPNLDDAIWFRAYRHTGNRRYREVGLEIADRLLQEENPPGNWACYGPSSLTKGRDHPRQAYWFGLPMLLADQETGDPKYLAVLQRSAEWHMNAQRQDGGLFRWTYHNGKTDSFTHETSGTACGAILWMSLHEHTPSPQYFPYITRALDFCLKMQITRPQDPNLLGALICAVWPDGTDRIPFRVRDLDAIFFVQAAAQLLANQELAGQLLTDD